MKHILLINNDPGVIRCFRVKRDAIWWSEVVAYSHIQEKWCFASNPDTWGSGIGVEFTLGIHDTYIFISPETYYLLRSWT